MALPNVVVRLLSVIIHLPNVVVQLLNVVIHRPNVVVRLLNVVVQFMNRVTPVTIAAWPARKTPNLGRFFAVSSEKR